MDYQKLHDDLMAAKKAAEEAATATEEEGPHTRDTLILILPYARKAKVLEATERAGLLAHRATRRGQSVYHVYPPFGGQKARRTAQVEAMAKVMRERGWDAGVFYMLD